MMRQTRLHGRRVARFVHPVHPSAGVIVFPVKRDIATPLPPQGDPWRDNEIVRRKRIREDAKRPISVNLAETIVLSETLSKFAGAARSK